MDGGGVAVNGDKDPGDFREGERGGRVSGWPSDALPLWIIAGTEIITPAARPVT